MEKKKVNNFLIVVNVILLIALIIMTGLYFSMRNTAKESLDKIVSMSYDFYNANERIVELETKLEMYENN
jgi:hypothetical protein